MSSPFERKIAQVDFGMISLFNDSAGDMIDPLLPALAIGSSLGGAFRVATISYEEQDPYRSRARLLGTLPTCNRRSAFIRRNYRGTLTRAPARPIVAVWTSPFRLCYGDL